MLSILRIPATATPPVTSANTVASSGMVVSMTAEARKRPMPLCGVTSPYPTVVAVVIAQYIPVVNGRFSASANNQAPASTQPTALASSAAMCCRCGWPSKRTRRAITAHIVPYPGASARPGPDQHQPCVVPPVVLGQHVVAEVVRRVAPHRVDVVAVSLGVVVLDEQRRSLDAEVMPLPGFGGARPGEGEVVQPGALQVVQLGPGHLVGQPPRERPDQLGQLVELAPVSAEPEAPSAQRGRS